MTSLEAHIQREKAMMKVAAMETQRRKDEIANLADRVLIAMAVRAAHTHCIAGMSRSNDARVQLLLECND